MSSQEEGLRPEEFAEAAAAAVADTQGRDFRDAAAVLATSGLFGVCATEESGGLGLGWPFGVAVCEAAGKLQLHFPLVEQMVLASVFANTDIAEALVSGNKVATIAWQGSLAEKAVTHVAYAADCDWVLVADGQGASLLEVASLALQANEMLDPDYPHYEISLDKAVVKARLSATEYATLQESAQVLYTGFVNGLGAGALQLAAEYMSTRVQFGRPLSAKQVVRHTLARMQLLHETSTAALHRVLSKNEFGETRSVAPVFSGALANAVFVLEKAIHLHGGMGFTWEVPLHYSLREVRKLEAAFNNGHRLEALGAQFIATV
ncbi:acyl-CoA dehydrogenase family protein [Advenella alkanexedens]|uniref:acyl-CoA dehydrogenase family protein n=1 Tax=Advenella alkanexedens TaxID=1481665 RepID=UPI002676DFD5|nr:acyl-CoA dehydrogenase family protein [Advenella alkanexedens]WKU20053.1 acyl-CoA dehydrogenase family protein [Advenella alkanexedens]